MGFTLIETIAAISLAAILMAPVVGLLHTSRELWEMHDSDRARITAMHGTLRHVSRRLRMAESVTAIETKSKKEKLPYLEIRNRNGQIERWSHDPKTRTVIFTRDGQSGVLADHIEQFEFEVLSAKGKPAKKNDDIRSVRCTVSIKLNRKQNVTRTSECWMCLRYPDEKWLHPGNAPR